MILWYIWIVFLVVLMWWKQNNEIQFSVGLTVIRVNEFPWRMQIDSIHKNHDGPEKSNIFVDTLGPWKFLTLEHKDATLLFFF